MASFLLKRMRIFFTEADIFRSLSGFRRRADLLWVLKKSNLFNHLIYSISSIKINKVDDLLFLDRRDNCLRSVFLMDFR
jgi:hypothetical protein